MQQAQKLQELEGHVLDVVETLRQLSIMIENIQHQQPSTGQEAEQNWYNQLNHLVSTYSKIQQLHGYENVQIPWQALQCVDNEQSPDVYLQEVSKLTQQKQNMNQGRKEAISELQSSLDKLIKEKFN